jgi:uncharacterized protein YdeI (YjbR/CyaY-like superfamily)
MPIEPKFFASPSAFRVWLEKNHDQVRELWVGLYKRDSGKPSITWPESVDAALCFGWIDGIRKRVDETSYTIRFTARKPRSKWSAINLGRVAEVTKLGMMHEAGLKVFEQRQKKEAGYSYEQKKSAQLGRAYEQSFRANKNGWKFFQAQPPWYRRIAAFWVISAKKEETRLKRLATLIEDSSHGQRIGPTRPSVRSK